MENNYYHDETMNLEGGYGSQNQTSTGMATDQSSFILKNDVDPSFTFGVVFLFFLVIVVSIYVYFAVAFQKMARKINIQDDWFAWVPVLNLVLILRIANRPVWWIVLMFIPIVQVIVSVIVWMDVAKAMGREEWWGILMIIPGVNLVVIGYLAFFDSAVFLQGSSNIQGESIPEGAVLADVKNTDFTEDLGMKNDATSQWQKPVEEDVKKK